MSRPDPCGDLDRASRLSRLAGRFCPLCRVPSHLTFDGQKLRCGSYHTWSNADAAEAAIVTARPLSLGQQREIRERANADAAAEEAWFQARLERIMGDRMPPEARRD